MEKNKHIIVAGYIGLVASLLVGLGEFLLHFDTLGRFDGGYDFMVGIDSFRTTFGHFIGVLSAPLYIVGFWHLMKMLEPANEKVSKIAFVVMSYGIFIGAIWIGSRANISAIVNLQTTELPLSLISLYDLRYENLLQVTRIAAFIFSIIFVWLVLTGRSNYPKWVALLNPIAMILVSFAIWAVIPSIGVYLMPIALNIAFLVLFIVSLYFAKKLKQQGK